MHSCEQACENFIREVDATTTLTNADDGVTVTVTLGARGYLVRMTDDDSGGIVGDRIFTDESAALAYAHKIVG
jgi:hypothetical protein